MLLNFADDLFDCECYLLWITLVWTQGSHMTHYHPLGFSFVSFLLVTIDLTVTVSWKYQIIAEICTSAFIIYEDAFLSFIKGMVSSFENRIPSSPTLLSNCFPSLSKLLFLHSDALFCVQMSCAPVWLVVLLTLSVRSWEWRFKVRQDSAWEGKKVVLLSSEKPLALDKTQ